VTKTNRTLQIAGVIIIAISLAAVALITYKSGSQTFANSVSSPKFNNNSQVISENKEKTIDVRIPLGDGRGPNYNPVYFVPSQIVIHAGDKVRWTNLDTVGHTATSTYFNSGLIWPSTNSTGQNNRGPTTFTQKFDKSGTFAYFCQIHPYMSGVVYVDVQETERVLSLKSGSTNYVKVNIEMPQNAAYKNNYGPYFIPSYAKVPMNSAITWTNKDYVTHTATATDGSFDTQPILPGESRTFQINHTPGTIGYYCEIHPWMQATIEVSPSSAISKKA
jgi:plastocyanin